MFFFGKKKCNSQVHKAHSLEWTTPQITVHCQEVFVTSSQNTFNMEFSLKELYIAERRNNLYIKKSKLYFSTSSCAFSAWLLKFRHSCFNRSTISFNIWFEFSNSFSDCSSEVTWICKLRICLKEKKKRTVKATKQIQWNVRGAEDTKHLLHKGPTQLMYL